MLLTVPPREITCACLSGCFPAQRGSLDGAAAAEHPCFTSTSLCSNIQLRVNILVFLQMFLYTSKTVDKAFRLQLFMLDSKAEHLYSDAGYVVHRAGSSGPNPRFPGRFPLNTTTTGACRRSHKTKVEKCSVRVVLLTTTSNDRQNVQPALDFFACTRVEGPEAELQPQMGSTRRQQPTSDT